MNKAVDPARSLRIGGFLPFTSVDYPGALAAVIFCQGCPLRCVYCHNRELLPIRRAARTKWEDVCSHLVRRAGLLDAVVFSGGEPLMQRALTPAIALVKKQGFKVGLHTSGIAPDRLSTVLPLLDWVGFDVKTSFDKYEEVTQVKGAGEKVRQSLAILASAGIDIEIRTTIWPRLVDSVEVRNIAEEIAAMGFQNFAIQEARDPQTNMPKGGEIFGDLPIQERLRNTFSEYTIRRAA